MRDSLATTVIFCFSLLSPLTIHAPGFPSVWSSLRSQMSAVRTVSTNAPAY